MAKNSFSQEANQLGEDPYIDPVGANEILNPKKRTDSARAFMFGFSYGLNPIILLAPALNLAIYWDPLIIGMELSDSEILDIWGKERRENFGSSRFYGQTQYIKLFFGDNFYFLIASEKRRVNLWNRTYNRDSGEARFDMYVDTTLGSLGAGLLRFNENGFLGIDILRLNFVKNEYVKIVDHWETWTENTGTRKQLDENIAERSNKWKDILNSPTGFLITAGLYF